MVPVEDITPIGEAYFDLEGEPTAAIEGDCMLLKQHIEFDYLQVLILQKLPTHKFKRIGYREIGAGFEFFHGCAEQVITIV